jgi:hypothetical protein
VRTAETGGYRTRRNSITPKPPLKNEHIKTAE